MTAAAWLLANRAAAARCGLALLLVLLLPAAVLHAADDAPKSNPSGRPLPRYVSLKASTVNARKGPGYDYPVAWIYQRPGLPVEVIKEYDTWRQIRDSEGSEGWVLQSLLSGRRTALVLPWEVGGAAKLPQVTLRRTASPDAAATAIAEAGALAEVEACDGRWCRIAVSIATDRTTTGYAEQSKLWGVYRDEIIE